MLHEFMEVGSNFRDWIRRRIDKFGFAENADNVVHRSKMSDESTNNLQPRIDYGLTLDMAKQPPLENSYLWREFKSRQGYSSQLTLLRNRDWTLPADHAFQKALKPKGTDGSTFGLYNKHEYSP
jgi:hypothetical protein